MPLCESIGEDRLSPESATVNRRDFLRMAALKFTAAALAPSLLKHDSVSAKEKNRATAFDSMQLKSGEFLMSVDTASDGSIAIAVGNKVHTWIPGENVLPVYEFEHLVKGARFALDGRVMAVQLSPKNRNAFLQLLDMRHQGAVMYDSSIPGQPDIGGNWAISPDGSVIAATQSNHQIVCFDRLQDQTIATLPAEGATNITFSNDNVKVAAILKGRELHAWNLQEAEQSWESYDSSFLTTRRCAFGRDSQTLVSHTHVVGRTPDDIGGAFCTWNANSGTLLQHFPMPWGASHIKHTADGQKFACAVDVWRDNLDYRTEFLRSEVHEFGFGRGLWHPLGSQKLHDSVSAVRYIQQSDTQAAPQLECITRDFHKARLAVHRIQSAS